MRGLTTAACVWFVAGLGIVLGNKNYELAIISTLFVLSVLTYFERMTSVMQTTNYRKLNVLAQCTSVQTLVEEIKQLLEAEKVRVIDLDARASEGDERQLTIYVKTRRRNLGPRITERICELKGVKDSHWRGLS